MRRPPAAACGMALGFWVATAHVVGGQAPLSLDRGVYSIAQAARGKAHYEAFCASCHLGDLSGSLAADTGAPPLRDAPFVASIAKTGVAVFFDQRQGHDAR